MFYMFFDADGNLTARFIDNTGVDIPDGAIEVEEDIFHASIDYDKSTRLVDGNIVITDIDIPLDQIKLQKIYELKAFTQTFIYNRFPQHKQANLTARALELIHKGNLDQDESVELDAIQNCWSLIKSVRIQENILEQLISEATTTDDLDSIGFDLTWDDQ